MTMPDASISRQVDALEVRWPSGDCSRLPYLWLRDNCSCEECRVIQTSERRFMISDVPVDIAPIATSLDGDDLTVTWPDGHESRYSGAEIRDLSKKLQPSWSPWDADYSPRRYRFDAFLHDDQVAAKTIREFLGTGAIILECAPTQPGTLEQLAPRLGPIREVLFARIHDVHVDPDGYNVAHTSIALPPHNDCASYSWPPSVQALHMLVNEAGGGESLIVDGWQVLTRLRDEQPSFYEALSTTPVPFREFDAENETHAIEPIIRLDSNGEFTALRFSNQLMQVLDPDADGVAEFYRAYHALCILVADDAFRSTFRLEGGDILVLAAHRVLHGREAFEATGKRHLQDAYFELDNVRNHLVVLERKEMHP
jgi:gamma-butyrobetaine dioxygenase